jgi:hypothetical protein
MMLALPDATWGYFQRHLISGADVEYMGFSQNRF